MEVVVKMEGSAPHPYGSEPESSSDAAATWTTLMLGRFVMVCRDSRTHKARRVPPLVIESEEEQALWDMGDDYQKQRKESSKLALDKVPVCIGVLAVLAMLRAKPTSQEVKELHGLMLQVVDRKVSEINGEKVVLMKDTEVSFGISF